MRKIVIPGMKDATGAYVKEPAPIPPAPKPYVEPNRDDVSLDDLLSRCLITLWRQVYALQEASSGGGKLTPAQALELRENTKLLMDLKKREKDLLDKMSDEELEELARKKKAKNGIASSRRARPKKTGQSKDPAEDV